MDDTRGALSTAGQAQPRARSAARKSDAAIRAVTVETRAPAAVRPIIASPAGVDAGGEQLRPGAPATSRVRDIKCGSVDSRGSKVVAIYAVKSGVYAIYRAEKIMVQFADEPALADTQRRAIANLAGLRARLEILTSRFPCAEYYNAQTAAAFQLALDGEPGSAKAVMEQAVATAAKEGESRGRVQYLLCGFVSGLLFLAIFAAGHWLKPFGGNGGDLWLAAVGGTIGAFFSLSLAIRSRTVALDVDRRTNVMDGILRVLVGVIAGAALTLLLATGIVPELKVQEASIVGPDAGWEAAVIVGFIAGFLERLLPDLLEGRQAVSTPGRPG